MVIYLTRDLTLLNLVCSPTSVSDLLTASTHNVVTVEQTPLVRFVAKIVC